MDFEDPGNPEEDDAGWETEDEMEADEAEQDDSELTFSKHTGRTLLLFLHQVYVEPTFRLKLSPIILSCPGSVFCVSLDPATNSLAVTGGEDDKAYVWRVSDGEVLLECTGELIYLPNRDCLISVLWKKK